MNLAVSEDACKHGAAAYSAHIVLQTAIRHSRSLNNEGLCAQQPNLVHFIQMRALTIVMPDR